MKFWLLILAVFVVPGFLALAEPPTVNPSTPRTNPFATDYKQMLRAAKLWNFSTKDLDKFLNPFHGPTEFHLNSARAPWAGNYFSMEQGGMAFRWQNKANPLITDEELRNVDWAKKLSSDQIRQLSPAEKYDLLNGNYDLPMTKAELTMRGPKRTKPPKDWEGFCNGVRCAGINLPEPKHTVTTMNPDGLKITFEPADLKALAGASYFYVERYAQLGKPSQNVEYAYQPPNPAVFDLNLRYFLAKKKRAFVVDSSLDAEIWNESVTGYERTLGPNSQGKPVQLTYADRAIYPWAQSKIEIIGTLNTLGEIAIADSNRPTTEDVATKKLSEKIKIHYTLYLDREGNARDGIWHHDGRETRGVDFVWFGQGKGTDAKERAKVLKSSNEAVDHEKIVNLFHLSQTRSCRVILGGGI